MILQQLSNRKSAIPLDQEKEVLKKRFISHVDSIQSPTKLRIVKDILAPLSPTLNAVDRIKSQHFPTPTLDIAKQPHNVSITAQRRLWSTKKKRNKSSGTDIHKKPTVLEKTNMAASLLLS